MRREALTLLTAIAAALIVGSGVAAAATSSVTVPGTADPWLAGMPDGSIASFDGSQYDTVPAQSPTQVTSLDLTAGGVLTFDVSGSVNFFPDPSGDPPDGNSNIINFSHYNDYPILDPENGMSDINAPANALIGVFLGPDRPDTSSAPSALDFGTSQSRDYTTISPSLKQVFFIGDGRTSTGEVQSVNIPNGATRLFLGPMDGVGWWNNSGSFNVQVHHAPPAPTCAIGEIEPPVNDVSSATDQGMSAYKYGSRGVIPAKFRAACNGDPIDTQAEAEAHPMKLKLTKLGATPDQDAVVENTVTGSANTGDLFRFDDVADHYIYNIGVKNLASGTYKLTISEANGGATHDEWFSVK
jgi:hypothetical protein